MTGQTDLNAMLASIEVTRRPGVFTFVNIEVADRTAPEAIANELITAALATITEVEGVTYVVPVETAQLLGFDVTFRAAWLTLEVHSALDAVGLTAAVSSRLAEAGIACNMLAGFHHDHLLVPVDTVSAAIEAIDSLRNDERPDRRRAR